MTRELAVNNAGRVGCAIFIKDWVGGTNRGSATEELSRTIHDKFVDSGVVCLTWGLTFHCHEGDHCLLWNGLCDLGVGGFCSSGVEGAIGLHSDHGGSDSGGTRCRGI